MARVPRVQHVRERGVSRRTALGGWLWAVTALQWVAQVVTAARWPEGYSWGGHAISDLGVTVCGTFSEQESQVRQVCSPAHAVFNVSLVATGLLLAVGALLLMDAWPRRGAGRAAMVAMVASGLLVAVVGLTPWDLQPDLHDLAALGQAVTGWVALALVLVAVRGAAGGPWRAVRILSAVVLVLAPLALVAFLAGSDGVDLVLPWGLWERLAFESLTLWAVAVGLVLVRLARTRATNGTRLPA